jgi:acetyl esterase/lipase
LFGVPVTLSIFPVPTHDFHVFWTFLPEAANAIEQVGAFLRERVAQPGELAQDV